MNRKSSRSVSVSSTSSSHLSMRWDAKMSIIRTKYDSHPRLINLVQKLASGCQEIASFAHEYDYGHETPGNGYRSTIRVIDKFLSLLINQRLDFNNLGANSKANEEIFRLEKMAGVFLVGLSYMEKMRRSSLESGREEDGLVELFCEEEKLNYELFAETINFRDDIKYFFGKFSNFWLNSSFQSILKGYMILITLFWGGIINFHKFFWQSNYVSETFANFCKNVTVSFVAKIWGLSELWFYKKLIPFLLYRWSPKVQKTLLLETTRIWTIKPPIIKFGAKSEDGKNLGAKSGDPNFGAPSNVQSNENHSTLFKMGSGKKKKKVIRCRYLLNEMDATNETLVFHIHGAGFVSQTPDAHECYLRDWSCKLGNVPILSIDYSLSPDHKYPCALQECLDTYLYITSGDGEVLERLRFHPQRIILVGDSAGATLCIALALVINDLRRIDPFIQEPVGIVSMYGAFNMHYSVTPSKLACAYDTFLSTGVILEVLRSYIPLDGDIDAHDVPSHGTWQSMSGKNWRQSKEDGNFDKRPWYKKSNALDTIKQLNLRTRDPYVSPVYYQDFDGLSNVSLYLILGQFDPLLDDSVTIAKKWAGRVNMDIIPDLGHGFLYMLSISTPAKLASDLCGSRLIQAVQRSADDAD